MNTIIHKIKSILTHPPKNMIGRWSLKQKKLCEDITVFNANRDHCGDQICGKPQEYIKLVPKKLNQTNQ
jgi:hypothetical protein